MNTQIKSNWSHDQLANDLANHLLKNPDRIIWTDMQLGPSGSPRPDVYTIPKSYANFRPMAYEIKVSVADFRSDITKGKWQSYLKYACAVIFAVPKGLISKEDIPKGCGLIVRSESGWRMVKGPTLTPIKNDLPADFWIKLVIDGVDRSKGRYNHNELEKRVVHKKIKEKYGQQLAYVLSQKDKAEQDLENRTSYLMEKYKILDVFAYAEREKGNLENLKQIKTDLCAILDISPDSNRWSIESALKDKLKLLKADPLVAESNKKINSAIETLERNLISLKELKSSYGEKVSS